MATSLLTSRRGTLQDKPSSAFTPSSVANLHAWWDGTSITGVSDGATTGSWADSGPNGYTAGSSGLPVYRATGVSGKPGLEFTAADLGTNASGSLTAFTIFAAIHPINPTGNQSIYCAATGTNGIQVRLSGTNPAIVRPAVAVIGTSSGTVSAGTPVILAFTFTANTSWAIHINGTAAGSGSTTQTPTAGLTGWLGNTTSGGNQRFNGRIGDLIIYSAALNSTDRGSVTSYLGTKYGITVT